MRKKGEQARERKWRGCEWLRWRERIMEMVMDGDSERERAREYLGVHD